MPNTGSRRSLVAVALAVLVLLAAVERFCGLSFGLPYEREGDTAIVHAAAFHDRPAGAEPTDAAYPSTVYPLLLSRLLEIAPGTNYPRAAPVDAPLEAHLAAAAEPYVRARVLVALLSLLIVPFTYFLARNWLGPWWSVLAAALAATSLSVLELSQQAKPHGALAGTNALALGSVMVLLRKGSLRAYAFAGIGTALALATLHSGFFVVPPFFLAHWLGWRSDRVRRRWWGLSLAVVIQALAFVVAYPFVVFGDPLSAHASDALDIGQNSIPWSAWSFGGFGDMLPAMWSIEPVLCVTAALAAAVLLLALAAERVRAGSVLRPATLVMALHVVVTVGLFGLHEPFFWRYFAPLVPCWCIVSAAGLRALCSAVPSVRGSRAASAFAGIAVLALPAWVSVRHVVLRSRPDTESLAAHWIEEHVPPQGGIIAVDPSVTLPLAQSSASVLEMPAWAWKPWQHYEAEVMPSDAHVQRWKLRTLLGRGMMRDGRIDAAEARARIEALDPQWIVVGVPAAFDAPRNATRSAVRELAVELAVVFSADGPSGSLESDPTMDADPQHIARLLRHERHGQTVEIYRMR